VPVVFGSSLEGTARTYSAYKLIESDTSTKAIQEKNKESLDNKPVKRRDYLDCAGKSDEETEKRVQCGACEICLTYGFSTKEKSLHGMAQFSDAQILFFPVHTIYGPVWVTCPGILKDFLVDGIGDLDSKLSIPKNNEEKAWTNLETKGKINLGWLYLGMLENNGISPEKWTFKDGEKETEKELGKIEKLKEILDRMVIVSDSLFSQVVNSNLEVRTSVSIDSKTGAAAQGALFTYEAIPRATVMYFTVNYLNPENFDLSGVKFKEKDKKDKNPEMNDMIDTVKKGLELFEFLGIGGMNTRGFGRFKILNGDLHGE
jgi:CRISPR-associated protein Cmr4